MSVYDPYEKSAPSDIHLSNGALTYVMIPKSASSTLNSYCNYLKFHRIRYNVSIFDQPVVNAVFDPDGFSNTTFFSVIRDPVERWISGITQSFRHRKDIAERLMRDIGPFIEDPCFDLHQWPQAWFLRNIGNPVIYKIENLDSLMGWVCSEIGVDFPEITNINVASEDPEKTKLSEAIRRQMPEYEAVLRAYYSDDAELYERAL